MSLKDIQKQVDYWTGQFTPQYWPPYEILARLTEETGELAREVNHLYGTKKKKPDEKQNTVGAELSDLLFTIVCMANSQGIDLQSEWNKMFEEKMHKRDRNRFSQTEKDK